MITTFADPFDALFNLQRALEGRLASDWLHDQTTTQGPFPPINVFQQGDDILAIIELPGIEKDRKYHSHCRQEVHYLSRWGERPSSRAYVG